MGLLAAGGAILGVFEAPTGADLTVHNGAGETLEASRVVGTYTSSELANTVVAFEFTAPDHTLEKAIGPHGKVEAHRNVTGSAATGVLGPVNGLLSMTTFSAHGSYYDNTRPASDLVPAAERAEVSGTESTRVQVEGGYVVAVILRIDANEGTQHIAETVDYRLSRVDGWTRSR
jgi:hypothetical protein